MDVRTYKLESGEEVPITPLASAELESDDVVQLADAAGVDKYVASVLYGRLSQDWRGHAAGALAVKHGNSSGTYVHVEAKAPAVLPAATPAPPTEPTASS